MPGGRRNPFSLSSIVEKVGDVVQHSHRPQSTSPRTLEKFLNTKYVDLEIQFMGADGLPKLDVVGSADPYFVAKLDDHISFVSTVKINTLAPEWDEVWRVENVPATADLYVEVFDKDDNAPHDDYIGKFSIDVAAGARIVPIEGPFTRRRGGEFTINITSKPSQDPKPYIHSYVFSGPIRYSRHNSPTIGLFANLPDTRLYSTWKMYLKNVPRYFTADLPAQHWNTEYKAAQQIFSGPTSVAVRAPIQAGHRMLYARTTSNGFGVINGPDDVFTLFHGGEPARPSPARSSSLSLSRLPTSSSISSSSRGSPTRGSPSRSSADLSRFANRIKPTVYTYILSYDDDSFRFSETGAAFFVDFASKHALHSNCAPCVRYSGEFHPRPAGGWARFSDSTPDADVRWELVVDNNSGTYAPDPALLPVLRALLQENFAGFEIVVMDFHEEALKESREACKKYALEHRGVRPEEQEPTRLMGGAEETLAHEARSVPVVAGRAVQDVKQKIKDKLAHAGKAS